MHVNHGALCRLKTITSMYLRPFQHQSPASLTPLNARVISLGKLWSTLNLVLLDPLWHMRTTSPERVLRSRSDDLYAINNHHQRTLDMNEPHHLLVQCSPAPVVDAKAKLPSQPDDIDKAGSVWRCSSPERKSGGLPLVGAGLEPLANRSVDCRAGSCSKYCLLVNANSIRSQ